MANEAAPAMHADFARWYAPLTIADDPDRRGARWAGVHALTKSADGDLVESLVRLAFGHARLPASAAFVAKFQGLLKAQDATFDPNTTARELQLLAGAALHVLFDRQDDVGGAAALSVLTASFEGARIPDLPLDIVSLAEGALDKLANSNRSRPNLAVATDPPKLDFAAVAKKVKDTPNWESVIEAITSMEKTTQTALRILSTRQASAISAVDRFLKIQDEELQMLWWLTGSRSLDLDVRFDQVAAEAQPLLFAKELADSTAMLPGPRSIKSMLLHAGIKERKKVGVLEAITASEFGWLQTSELDESPSSLTLPIHFAIRRHIEAGGGDTWVPNWAAVTGVDATRQLPSLVLAIQFYRERLLLSFV